MSIEAGGYDEGYAAVSCFWGTNPSRLVRSYLEVNDPGGMKVLDLGAGEGKNAAAFSRRGAIVDAIEMSKVAIENGLRAFSHTPINWINVDAALYTFPSDYYDIVICYGLIHCLRSKEVADRMLSQTKRSLRTGGTYILAAFNDGPHDLSAHPDFKPLLLSHAWYLAAFRHWNILAATDEILHESHPHNGIQHFHSMTRIIAKCP